MKGFEINLIAYMDGAKKCFVIPVYQRNYDWEIENCKQLFDAVSGSEHLDLKLDDVYIDLELNDQRENGKDAKPIQGAVRSQELGDRSQLDFFLPWRSVEV